MVSIEEISKQYVKESINHSEHLPEKFYDLDLDDSDFENECIQFANGI